MRGEVLINDWKVALEDSGFDPKLGIGRVLIGSDGFPVFFIWIHVDEIFLHGLTHAKCTSALKKILDFMVLVFLIFHPTKLKPPAQIHIFCWFLYDSELLLMPLGNLSYTMFTRIFIMRPLRVLTTSNIFTTED
jgi:hypothetical protein